MNAKVELDDLVTGAEIARRLKISKQRAHQLAASDGFPAPLGKVGNYIVYRWPSVEKWAIATGRLKK